MKATILFGMTGSGKTFILNRDYANKDYNIISFDKSWSNKEMLYKHIEKNENVIIDNEGLNVEQLYKCIRDLQSEGYFVELIYIKSKLKEIKQRATDNIIYEQYETLDVSIEILSNVANEFKIKNN